MSKLETITDTLAKAVPKFEEGTILTSAELMTERRTNLELRTQYFYTNNYGLYTVEKGTAILYFGAKENNPIFKNIGEACKQLFKISNYVPSAEDSEAAKKSALRVQLSHLNLKGCDKEYSYFEIDTEQYDNLLNGAQRKLAEKVYGEGQDFVKNMKMLSDAKIGTTRIYVLNPEYVIKTVQKDSAIARASWLDSFNVSSSFGASGRSVDLLNAVRGVRKELSAEGRTQKTVEDKIDSAYTILMADYAKSAEKMTPDIAAGITSIVVEYLKLKK